MCAVSGEAWRALHDERGHKRDWYCEDVLGGRLSIRVIYEDDRVLAIHHPYPEAEIHAVVLPKSHVESLMAVEFRDPALLVSMVTAVQEVARKLGLTQSGFRLEANAVCAWGHASCPLARHGTGRPAASVWCKRAEAVTVPPRSLTRSRDDRLGPSRSTGLASQCL